MTEPTTCTVPVEFLRGVIALCTQRGYSPENIEAWSKDDKWVADLWRQAEQVLAIAKWGTPAPVGVEPFGIWHEGETEDESDFFLFKDSGDVACPTCIKLYTADQALAMVRVPQAVRGWSGADRWLCGVSVVAKI